jgi:hypothetical protein
MSNDCTKYISIRDRIESRTITNLASKNEFGEIDNNESPFNYYNNNITNFQLTLGQKVYFFSFLFSEVDYPDFDSFSGGSPLLIFNIHSTTKKITVALTDPSKNYSKGNAIPPKRLNHFYIIIDCGSLADVIGMQNLYKPLQKYNISPNNVYSGNIYQENGADIEYQWR